MVFLGSPAGRNRVWFRPFSGPQRPSFSMPMSCWPSYCYISITLVVLHSSMIHRVNARVKPAPTETFIKRLSFLIEILLITCHTQNAIPRTLAIHCSCKSGCSGKPSWIYQWCCLKSFKKPSYGWDSLQYAWRQVSYLKTASSKGDGNFSWRDHFWRRSWNKKSVCLQWCRSY